ncbi:MAG: hypothetical protein ACTSPL_03935, partial [Candidatus Odinarchaeia archaeon]
CNDTRYRFWVVGQNYTFWIYGDALNIDFEYEWKVIDSGGFFGTYYQLYQAYWTTNNSVVSEQPAFYIYTNSTSKGYKVLGTDGWLNDAQFWISESETTTYAMIWINVTRGDFWEVVYNETINVPNLAYGITILSATWAESSDKINVFVEVEGGGYLKAYENYTNLVAPAQADGTMVWDKTSAVGTTRVDVLMSKYSDFRSYANMTFYYTVSEHIVYFRYVNWFDNTTSFSFTDFLTYIDGELIVRDYAYVSNTFNLTVTDYGGTVLYSNASEVAPSNGLIVLKLKVYSLSFYNPGYDELYVNLTIAGINYPELIKVPPLSIWGTIRLYNTTISYTTFYKSAETYTTWEEGEYTISSDYTVRLTAHKITVDVPQYPRGAESADYFFWIFWALAGLGVIMAVGFWRGASLRKEKVEEKPLTAREETKIFYKNLKEEIRNAKREFREKRRRRVAR